MALQDGGDMADWWWNSVDVSGGISCGALKARVCWALSCIRICYTWSWLWLRLTLCCIDFSVKKKKVSPSTPCTLLSKQFREPGNWITLLVYKCMTLSLLRSYPQIYSLDGAGYQEGLTAQIAAHGSAAGPRRVRECSQRSGWCKKILSMLWLPSYSQGQWWSRCTPHAWEDCDLSAPSCHLHITDGTHHSEQGSILYCLF